LWDHKHQTFADRVVGSVVVSTRGAVVCPRCRAVIGTRDRHCRSCGLLLLAPEGWYADPAAPRQQRYWNGRQWTGWTHPPPAEADRRTDVVAEPPRGVVLAVVGFALSVVAAIAVTAALRAAGRPGGDVVLFIVSEGLLWIGMISTAWLVSVRRGTGNFRRDFGWDFVRRDFGIGALGAVVGRSATVIVTIPLYAAFHSLVRNPSVGLPLHKLTPGLFAVYAVTAVVGAPIVEELFFRGVIQTRLVYRMGAARGIALASAMFGAAHLIGWTGPGSLLAAAAIAGGGSVLGYLRHRTGRLGTSMVAHGLFNAFAVILVGAGVGR
jgi:membrane protease YdiL (CAAX protease family)